MLEDYKTNFMKIRLFITLAMITSISFGQEPFEKDGKWGISKNGDANDSIIFRAEYDKIQSDYSLSSGYVYSGLKNGEWQLLTGNKLVNQQRYQSITVPSFSDSLAIGFREGYIDIVDMSSEEFLVRGVQADQIVENEDWIFGNEPYLLTKKGKSLYGLIYMTDKKEILKAEYEVVRLNEPDAFPVEILAFNALNNYTFDKTGKALHTFADPQIITSIEAKEGLADCFVLLSDQKKGQLMGFYDAANKWLVPVIYSEISTLDASADAIVVKSSKGYGLYFQGKLLLEPIYLEIAKSDKQGYLAIVTSKKGTWYVTAEGKFIPMTE